MFKVVEAATGESVGSVGYWRRGEDEGQVYETGWAVLPAFQGRGIATIATAQVIELLRAAGTHRYLYAYPFPWTTRRRTRSAASSAFFTLVNVRSEYEYPRDSGNILRCNDWRLDLRLPAH